MTTNNARVAFLRTYHIPAILVHYPRLVRAMQWVAGLNGAEAAACIRDLKAGHRWSGEAVDHYGGTHKVVADAWTYRKAARMLDGFSPRLRRAPDVSDTGTRSHVLAALK
jgi:hypothetical protein